MVPQSSMFRPRPNKPQNTIDQLGEFGMALPPSIFLIMLRKMHERP
jgi:hypothetical protein